MQPLEQVYIAGSSVGLKTDIKPFLQPDQAFSVLENAYVWREQVKKRECLDLLGRLQRKFTAQALGVTDGSGNFSGNLKTIFTITETNATIAQGSITVTVGAQVFTETTNGNLSNGAGGTGTINYLTGDITINTNPDLAATPITISFGYYPNLPVMGIWQREIAGANDEQTIFWDTTYAYVNGSGLENGFEEFIPGTTWNGTDSDYFWATNYRGSEPFDRLMFVTNFFNDAGSPIRYTDGSAWTNFMPAVDATNFLVQAKIMIPYYGRLLAFNVWEGTGYTSLNSNNYYNRCRFSQIGSPIAADAWRSDIFGKGGFIDAPVNEEILSVTFFKNTLIVGFERSTWQLRYVGEYGLPFIWERISSDFGCESTNSAIVFDQGVLQVGDRAIVSATSNNVERIDLQIPDLVFNFKNDDFGKSRIAGARNFQKEVVYWSWVDTTLESVAGFKFPNRTLLYNYRNNTYAIFRDNVNAFGTYQSPIGITWDRTDIYWDDDDVFWSNDTAVPEFPAIVSGNQEGFVHYYARSSFDEISLFISAMTNGASTVRLTVPNHNLADNEWIQITGAIFTTGDPGFNSRVYQIRVVTPDEIDIFFWDGNSINVTLSTADYIGNGAIILLPNINIQTKDFNPYQAKGSQLKLSYVDFLMDAFPQGIITVNVILNASSNISGNVEVGNNKVESGLNLFGSITNASQSNPAIITSPNHGLRTGNSITINDVVGMTELNTLTFTVTYINGNTFSLDGVDSTGFTTYITGGNWQSNNQNLYIPGSNYAWHRFFATCTGQFIRLQLTYSDEQMANIINARTNFVMNAIALWVRPGSRNILP